MSRSGVRGQVVLGFGIVISLLAILTVMAHVGLTEARHSQQVLVERHFAVVTDLLRFRSNVNAERLNMSVINDVLRTDRGAWLNEIEARRRANAEILERLQVRLDETRQRDLLRELIAVRESFIEAQRAQLRALDEGRPDDVQALYLGPQSMRHARLSEIARELEERETAKAQEVITASARRAQLFSGVFVGAGALSILAAAAVGLFTHRAITTHIGERQRAEEALRRNAAFLRQTQEVTHVGGWEYDLGAKRMSWTEETYRIYEVPDGFEPADASSVMQFYAGPSRDRFAEAFRKCVENAEPFDLELQLVTGAGHRIWARTVGRAERQDGRVVRAFGNIVDVTARKEAELELQRSESSLKEAQRLAHLGNWELDVASGKLAWSDEIYRIFEIERTSFGATYDTFVAAIHPEDRETVDRNYRDSVANRTPYEVTHRLLMKDGRVKHVHERGETFYDDSGRALRSIGTVQDVTERKLAEEAIRRYADDLRRSNQELEHFAYVSSHDLQEPLRTVGSFSQLLARRDGGRLDRDADEFIDFIVGGATRMQTLINDLLAFSRLGTRGNPFRRVACEHVLATARANLEAMIGETGAVIVHDPLPEVSGDDTQLVQLFQNLLGNAMKFRRPDVPPRIQLGAKPGPGEWEFSVRDNGIGIDPQYFERIFIIFQRLHGRDEYAGTGIGLAICKKIVERHGGRIWVESDRGAGSTFRFTLPAPNHFP